MMRFTTAAGLMSLLLATAACTQEPAMVDMRGQNYYGRNAIASNASVSSSHMPAYSTASPAPGVETTVEANAAPAAVSASDLAPPAKQAKAVTPQPASAKPQQIAAKEPAPINQWTHKPHMADATAPETQASPIYTQPVKTASTGFMWPVESHKVISGFGPKGGGKVNDGINIAATDGQPVWAAADGEVLYTGNSIAGYGNMVLIRHDGGKTTTYAHMGRVTVDKYDRVKQGAIIGYVGTSGGVNSPQLHFAIRNGKDPVDPTKYLTSKVASN